MRLKDNCFSSEPPTIVADVDGNVIFANSKATNMLYPVKTGDSISKFVDIDYIKKISLFEKRIDVLVPENCELERVVVKTVGTGITKTIELMFLHVDSDNDIIDDKRLFATYAEVIGANVTGVVMLERFLERIIGCMHADFRFAYRRLNAMAGGGENRLYTNFSHLCSLTVCAIIALNEIEYRNPIEISVYEMLGEYVLEMSVKKATFLDAQGLYDLSLHFPRATMRMVYVSSICEEDGIKYDFSVSPNKITYTFVISNMVNETGKFAYSPFGDDEERYIAHLIDMFMPINRAIEEQE